MKKIDRIHNVLLRYELPSHKVYSDNLNGTNRFLIDDCEDWTEEKKEALKNDIKKVIKGKCEVYL